MSNIFVVIFSIYLISCDAQQPLDEDGCPGPCGASEVEMSNDKLVDIWYLHASIPRFFEEDMKCTYINVTDMGEDHLYFVKHEFNNNTVEPRETYGAIEYNSEGFTSIYYTDLFLPFSYDTIALTEHYWILATCNECGFYSANGRGLYAYVFTRLQYPPCEMNDEILEILAECGIDDDYLIDQDQNGCTAC